MSNVNSVGIVKGNLTWEQVNNKTEKFLNKTNGLGESILITKRQKAQPLQVVNNYYGYNGWSWPWYHHHYHEPFYSYSNPTDRNEDKSRTAILFGALTAVYAVISVAENIASLVRFETEISDVKKFRNLFRYVSNDSKHNIDPSVPQKIEKMTTIKERIFTRSQTDAQISLALDVFLGIGAACLIRGGWIRSSPVVDTGIVITGLAVLASLFKWAVNPTKMDNERDAENLLLKVQQFRRDHPQVAKPDLPPPVQEEIKELLKANSAIKVDEVDEKVSSSPSRLSGIGQRSKDQSKTKSYMAENLLSPSLVQSELPVSHEVPLVA